MKRLLTVLVMVLMVSGAVAAQRPDIVIFLTDDHSQADSAPYGSRELRTPNMQRLANEGITFTRAFVASPSCAPSRAALLTGLMPARNGAEANHSKPRADIRKWPAYFQELGYEVAAFGKVSHYQHTVDYGFDHFGYDTFHDHRGIQSAADFLAKRSRTKPLCLFVGSNWPHVPWPTNHPNYKPNAISLPAGSVDTEETREWRARYSAAVSRADQHLGTIYTAARRTLSTNTIFLFSGDHGAQWPFGKWNLYEAGTCVPLIVVWPGVIKAESRTGAMVSWVDFLPTLLEAAGGNAPAGLDGRSFLPVLHGKQNNHHAEIFTTHSGDGRMNSYPMRAVRTDRWKYILNLHPEYAFTTHIDLPGNLGQRGYFASWEAAARTNEQAAGLLKRYHARPAEELYDLTADPNEQRNVVGAHREEASRLRAQLEKWMQGQDDKRTTFGTPRLLSDSTSFGPGAAATK